MQIAQLHSAAGGKIADSAGHQIHRLFDRVAGQHLPLCPVQPGHLPEEQKGRAHGRAPEHRRRDKLPHPGGKALVDPLKIIGQNHQQPEEGQKQGHIQISFSRATVIVENDHQ